MRIEVCRHCYKPQMNCDCDGSFEPLPSITRDELPITRKQMLLLKLGEECNEVAQRVLKAIRFGFREIQEGQPLNNCERVTLEFGDLLAVYYMLLEAGVIEPPSQQQIDDHKKKVEKWLSYSRQCGTLGE